MKNNTLTYRVCQVEKKVNNLVKKVDSVRLNDLPHVRGDLIRLKTKMNLVIGINLGAILLYAIISKVFGL
jgi:hypothetical protein